MGRPYIRLGDSTSHGGTVISATARMTIDGIPVARLGDQCTCPIPYQQAHPTNKILAGDGCRVCFQRKEIADAIGITIKSFDLVKP